MAALFQAYAFRVVFQAHAIRVVFQAHALDRDRVSVLYPVSSGRCTMLRYVACCILYAACRILYAACRTIYCLAVCYTPHIVAACCIPNVSASFQLQDLLISDITDVDDIPDTSPNPNAFNSNASTSTSLLINIYLN